MASDPSRRAFELFNVLVELPEPQRRERLAALHAEDTALAEAIERLLAADVEAEAAPDAPPLTRWASELTPAAPAPTTLEAGQTLGPWRLLAPLGEGGMGVVWLGERQGDGFVQRAAIKQLHLGSNRRAAHARFLRERGILARLEHPNIAGLLDAGVGEDGLPWFAMAHVEGAPIDRWCDDHRLDVRARVQLFLQVLDAVQYAHRNLVVHRDIKPANVMVDAGGHVKLLDFGLAKLLEEGVDAGLTRDVAMTPQFAAPEQLLGQAVTTATDIYQLGLLLHALLVGGHPYGVTVRTPLATLATTLDQPPQTLAAMARAMDAMALARRHTRRHELVRKVAGDLSAVVSSCIARAPEARYPSADRLADDLRRWLDGQPVSVRASSRGYRLRFFLRRHRWALASLAAVFCALAVGLGIALHQARLAQLQVQQARTQAVRAEQVKDLALSVFREEDPLLRDLANQRTPAQVVAAGIAALEQQDVDPALRGALLDDLGELQSNLGDPAGARRSLEQALALRTRQFGADSVEVMQTERKLALAAHRSLDLRAAMAHAQRAIAIAERRGTPHAVDAARARILLALVHSSDSQRDQALALAASGIHDLSAQLGASAPETLEARLRHAQILTQLRRDPEAIAELRGVVSAIETANGQDSARLLSPLIALAGVQRQAQQLEAAGATYARVVSLAQRHFHGKNRLLAGALSRYGMLLVDMGRLPEAKALLTKAEQALPEGESLELAQLLSNRTKLHLQLGEADAAEAVALRAFRLRLQGGGEHDGQTWYYASQWGSALALQGKLGEAERVQRDALARLEALLGRNGYQNALILDALAGTLHRQQRYAEEIPLRQRALALTASKYSTDHPLYQGRMKALREIEQAVTRGGALRLVEQAAAGG